MDSDYEQSRVAMAVILAGIEGLDWGFYSREDTRMHLQNVSLDNKTKYKVWLESRGSRVFEPDLKVPMPPRLIRALRIAVGMNQDLVETRWMRLMLGRDWLKLMAPDDLSSRGHVSLIAYPDTPGSRFVRDIDLVFTKQDMPKKVWLNPREGTLAWQTDIMGQHGPGSEHSLPLVDLIWTGVRSGGKQDVQ